MNRSKIIASTALASVMAASAANAEMSVNGLFAGKMQDNDGGMTSSFSTNSVYVSYSDSMDNGMGVSVAMSLTAAGLITDVNFDTGMGVVGLGTGQDSAADGMDGSPACFSLIQCGSAELGGYNDGDAASGNSIAYSNSMGGISFKVTMGMDGTYDINGDETSDYKTETVDSTMSYAASTSIMGASIAAGMSSIDYAATNWDRPADIEPSFVTVGYSIAGLNLGYAFYDGDNGQEETQMGVGTSVAGMNVGIQFADLDATTDKEMMEVQVSKSLGAASFGLDYTETDEAGGDTNDTDVWTFSYVVGF